MSPYLLSVLRTPQLDRLVQRAERRGELAGLTDQGLREAAMVRGGLAAGAARRVALAFALAREAARRHSGKRHFPVQLLGGAAMMGGALAKCRPAKARR